MNKKIALIAAALLAGVVVAYFMSKEEPRLSPVAAIGSAEDQATMYESFPNLPASNRFAIETADQIMDRFESDSGIVFLGFKECPWCQRMAPIINEAAERGGATIYYLDIKRLSENDPETYRSLISYLAPHLPKDAEGKVKISTPDISIVRNGEIIWRYEMDVVSNAERTPEAYWTETRLERINKQFDKQIKEMRKEVS